MSQDTFIDIKTDIRIGDRPGKRDLNYYFPIKSEFPVLSKLNPKNPNKFPYPPKVLLILGDSSADISFVTG